MSAVRAGTGSAGVSSKAGVGDALSRQLLIIADAVIGFEEAKGPNG
jgi:hypothetical protein